MFEASLLLPITYQGSSHPYYPEKPEATETHDNEIEVTLLSGNSMAVASSENLRSINACGNDSSYYIIFAIGS